MADIKGCGTITLFTTVHRRDGFLKLSNVLYVPALRRNLLSISSFRQTHKISFQRTEVLFTPFGSRCVARAVFKDGLYFLLQSTPVTPVAALADAPPTDNLLMQWHRRLNHIGFRSLQKLAKLGRIPGLACALVDDFLFCTGCTHGKFFRKPIPRTSKKQRSTTAPLQLIHSDVCGPFPVRSRGGRRYFVSFLDDYTRFSKVYFISKKSEVFKCFQQYSAEATKLHGADVVKLLFGHSSAVKSLRIDGGGEYASQEFRTWCADRGITLSVTTPDTPSHNSNAEHLGGVLQQAAKTILLNSGLPLSYWPEAVDCANFTRNRTIVTGYKSASPADLWYGKHMPLDSLRTFGCMCYRKLTRQPQGKLTSNGDLSCFLGYANPEGDYFWVLSISTGRISKSKDVVFTENSLYKDMSTPVDDAFLVSVPLVFQDVSGRSFVPTPPVQSPDTGVPPRRSPRPNITKTYTCFSSYTSSDTPSSFKDAVQSPDAEIWEDSMNLELSSLKRNDAYTVCDLPKGRKAVSSRWVFSIKGDGRYKSRVVAKGFTQIEGVDYQETFSPTLKMSTFRMLLSQTVRLGLNLTHLDVVTAFLNGSLEEEIYMKPPPTTSNLFPPNKVLRLNKALYGLKQSSRQWSLKLHDFMLSLGYAQSEVDPCLCSFLQGDLITYVAVYVDDLLIASNFPTEQIRLTTSLSVAFEMRDLGFPSTFLGIQLVQRDGALFIHQRDLVQTILARFDMLSSTPVHTPIDTSTVFNKTMSGSTPFTGPYRQAIGSLQYLVTCTRPDIAYPVSLLAKYSGAPTVAHWNAVKRVFRYLKGTSAFGISYTSSDKYVPLKGYADASWASNIDNRKSRTGYLFFHYGNLISWQSKQQSTIALSTCEAEYMALSSAVQESSFLRHLLSSLGQSLHQPVLIDQDNIGTIELAKHEKISARSKHIDIRHHYIRNQLKSKHIALKHCPTDVMLADMLTKALPIKQFQLFRGQIGQIL